MKGMNNLWLFHGVVIIICSIKLLNGSALTCINGNCQCASATPRTIIPEKFKCDGEPDCSDGSDEINCATRACLATEHKCGNGRCLKKEWLCDNYADCLDGSDEKMSLCNFTTCASDQFRCYNGICLPDSMKCDRDKDCLGGEDENDCDYMTNCSVGFFKCNNSKCIDIQFKCDGEDDCDDNSDETECGTTCSSDSFTCKSGQCIPQNLKCNGKNDCSDASDEDSCPTPNPPTCASDEFLCDGECKLNILKCDGEADCTDGTDELGCTTIKCVSTEDLCDDGKSCIMKYKFCNGRVDCADGSDEKTSRCSSTTTVAPTTAFSCGTNEYKCKDALKCISNTKTCDGKHDCPGGDDELSCLINECENDNGNCSHICHETDTSYYCSCKHGFKLLNDSKTCKDINECETFGKCSQVCTNTEGSYKCSCTSGYVLLPNGRSCIPSSGTKEKLLIAVGLDVRSINHDGSRMKCLVDKNTKNAIAVDVHQKKNMIFWIDVYVGKIFSSLLGRKDIPAKVVAIGSSLKDLAIDWIAEKLYWLTTSSKRSTIHVAEFNGSNHKLLFIIKEGIHSIALDPLGGYLYWTSSLSKKISRAYMNGDNKEDIITTSLIAPTGLTIDYPIKKLFWLDSRMHVIESSDLDGKNRHRIQLYNPRHLYDIAVFGDNVYWSDSVLKTVSSANKFTGENKTVLIKSEDITSFVPKGISINHLFSQPSVANPCTNNGGCSHLCLRVPNGFKCACPKSGVLLPDKKNCKMPAKPTTTAKPKDSTSTTSTKDSTTLKTKESLVTVSKVIPTSKPKIGSRSEGSGVDAKLIGGIIGAILILLVVIIVIVWCRRKKNARKMEVHYSSEAPTVKILPEGRNPTQSKKTVDRDAYLKFANQNFKEFDVEEDDDEDLDNIGEKQPVLKTFKGRDDEEGLIGDTV